jgi:2-amino-4-hydroxy-6-hydroxymethyldihydropteridine diphosphokinase
LKGSPLTLTEPAFISLGSNIKPELNLIASAQFLIELGEPVAASNVYLNPAVGPTPQADFMNAAVLVSTSLDAFEIRRQLRQIEVRLGRQRTADKYAPRTIDLDLCLLDQLVIDRDPVVLPDPDLIERSHLAVPMAELAPDFIHPVAQKALAVIAAELAPHENLQLVPECSHKFQQAFLQQDQDTE